MRFFYCFSLLCLLMSVSASQALDPSWAPWEMSKRKEETQNTAPEQSSSTALLTCFGYIRAYQRLVSPVYNTYLNPGGCNFVPSCSHYGLQAFKSYGLLKGWVMTSDRVLRCHPGARAYYPVERVEGTWKAWDPPRWLPRSQKSETAPREDTVPN